MSKYQVRRIQFRLQGREFDAPCLVDDKTFTWLTIDDNSLTPEDSYVSILDGVQLADAGIVHWENRNGKNVWLQSRPIEIDDYNGAVMYDRPYNALSDVARGTAWMQALNEYFKTVNNG